MASEGKKAELQDELRKITLYRLHDLNHILYIIYFVFSNNLQYNIDKETIYHYLKFLQSINIALRSI